MNIGMQPDYFMINQPAFQSDENQKQGKFENLIQEEHQVRTFLIKTSKYSYGIEIHQKGQKQQWDVYNDGILKNTPSQWILMK